MATTPPMPFEACLGQAMRSLAAFLAHFSGPAAPPCSPLTTRSSCAAFDAYLPAALGAHEKGASTSADAKATLELAFKQATDAAMRRHATAGTGALSFDHAANEVSLLVDAALWCKAHGLLEAIAHLGLIEDLLESQTLRICEELFTQVLSPRIDAFIRASDAQRARLLFFRLCNNLLRRLSKSANTFFAGQISMKISYICPVDERSAVNPLGRFNKENVTLAIDPPPVASIEPPVKEEGEADDAEMEGEAAASTTPESFYSLLWSLQSFFSNPIGLKTATVLADFHRSAEAVLAKFETVPLVEKEAVAAIISANGRGVGGASATPSVFPKYLTGGRLLELQMKDAVFRREVALQLLIFLAYVINPLGNVEVMREMIVPQSQQANSSSNSSKEAPTVASAAAVAQQQLAHTNLSGAFLPVAALPPLRTLFLRTLRLYKLTPPFAFQFSESFLALLAREHKFWTQWKENKCPPIERPPVSKRSLLQKVDVEALAKEMRDKKAGAAPGAAKDTADSKKRKASALGGGGFGGGFGRAKSSFDSEASLKSASGRLLMGTANLAKLWDPSLECNTSCTEWLKSEERSFKPDMQYKYVQTLVDEEAEFKKVSAARAAKRGAKLAESKVVKMEDGAEAAADEEDGGDQQEEEDDGELKLAEMLKSDSRKPWQFLRLCILTPEVVPIWLRADEDDEEEEGPAVTGLDLFTRSEGTLQKLLDTWATDRKKKHAPPAEPEVEAEVAVEAEMAPVVKEEAKPADATPADAETPQAQDTSAPTTPAVSTPAVSPTPIEESAATEAKDETEERPSKRVKTEATSDDTAAAATPTPAPEAAMDTAQ